MGPRPLWPLTLRGVLPRGVLSDPLTSSLTPLCRLENGCGNASPQIKVPDLPLVFPSAWSSFFPLPLLPPCPEGP